MRMMMVNLFRVDMISRLLARFLSVCVPLDIDDTLYTLRHIAVLN